MALLSLSLLMAYLSVLTRLAISRLISSKLSCRRLFGYDLEMFGPRFFKPEYKQT